MDIFFLWATTGAVIGAVVALALIVIRRQARRIDDLQRQLHDRRVIDDAAVVQVPRDLVARAERIAAIRGVSAETVILEGIAGYLALCERVVGLE